MVPSRYTVDVRRILKVYLGGQPMPKSFVHIGWPSKVQVIDVDAQVESSKTVRLVEAVVTWELC